MLETELLTPKELSRMLKISTAVLYVWCQRKAIPFVDLALPGKKRGCIRFEPEAVKQWLEDRKRGENGKNNP
jgi:predicted site-specific integrase-resolvase